MEIKTPPTRLPIGPQPAYRAPQAVERPQRGAFERDRNRRHRRSWPDEPKGALVAGLVIADDGSAEAPHPSPARPLPPSSDDEPEAVGRSIDETA